MRTHVCASVSACACSCAYAYASAWDIMQVADTVGLQKRYFYKTKQYVYRQVMFTNTKQNKKFTNTLFTKQNKIKVYRQVMFTKQDKTNVYKTKVYKHVEIGVFCSPGNKKHQFLLSNPQLFSVSNPS